MTVNGLAKVKEQGPHACQSTEVVSSEWNKNLSS